MSEETFVPVKAFLVFDDYEGMMVCALVTSGNVIVFGNGEPVLENIATGDYGFINNMYDAVNYNDYPRAQKELTDYLTRKES